LTERVVGEFEAALGRVEAPGGRAATLRFALVLVGLIAGLGLVALLAVRWFAAAGRRAGRSHRFPEVEVGRRLGAPYGGGRVIAGSFREPRRNA
jgi:hypothetical protein